LTQIARGERSRWCSARLTGRSNAKVTWLNEEATGHDLEPGSLASMLSARSKPGWLATDGCRSIAGAVQALTDGNQIMRHFQQAAKRPVFPLVR